MDRLEVHVRAAEAHFDALLQRMSRVDFQTMLAVHALLILATCWLAFARRRWATILAALAFAACSFAWIGVNKQWEGPVLLGLSPTHAVTQADLDVPIALAIALAVRLLRAAGRAWIRRRDARREQGVPSVFRTMWPKFEP